MLVYKLDFSFMSCNRKILLPLLIVLSLQFLSPGLFTGKSLSAPHPHPLPAMAHSQPRAAAFDFEIDPDRRSVLEADPRPKARVREFSAAKESAAALPRGSFFIGTILAAKVSRYLSKSVLNI